MTYANWPLHPEIYHDSSRDWVSFGWKYEALFCRICDMQFLYLLAPRPGCFGSYYDYDFARIHRHINEHGDGSKHASDYVLKRRAAFTYTPVLRADDLV